MNILVDSFVKWRIVDPRLFYISFGGDEQRAQDRMEQIIKAALNDEITKKTVAQVISGDRTELMEAIKKRISSETEHIGVQIVDVRLKRVRYVDQINSSVFERMKSERTRVANELRSTGEAESEKIRADAEKQRTVILAEAFRDAEKIKGEGDAKASSIYAQTFSKNPEFYRFYRSLQAYRESFKDKKDVLVVDPSSEFFRYMEKPERRKIMFFAASRRESVLSFNFFAELKSCLTGFYRNLLLTFFPPRREKWKKSDVKSSTHFVHMVMNWLFRPCWSIWNPS